MKTLSKTSSPAAKNHREAGTKPIAAWKFVPLLLSLGALAWTQLPRAPIAPSAPKIAAPSAKMVAAEAETASAQRVAWRIVNSFPHDRSAFLQGLLWDNGGWYESTGLEGQSTLRRVEFPSGRVLKKAALPSEVFGEGLVAWKDSLIQITWRSGVAYVWDKNSFRLKNQFAYDGEGWGITQDGQSLIMSDGSDTLFFRDPQTFEVRRRLQVTLNGRAQKHLNELEFIDGEVWANIWQTDLIARIDPKSGRITSFLDLSGILPRELRSGREDVLNGIAYDAARKRIWVSGKLWPRVFQIEVN